MDVFKINLNIIILLCIFLIVNGCNITNPKLIVENKNSIELTEKTNQSVVQNKYTSETVLSLNVKMKECFREEFHKNQK